MIKQLAHINIRTKDLQGTHDFYCQALGFTHGFDFQKNGKWFGYYLKAGSQTFIEVFEGDPGQVGNINHLALEVDDLDESLERLRKCGIPVGEKKLGADQSWQAWLEDPNGVRIELHQYTAESSQLTGQTCIVNW